MLIVSRAMPLYFSENCFHFFQDFRATLKELSLDDLERLGHYHLTRESGSTS